MVPGQRINVDLEEGKHLLIKFLSHSAELDEHGKRTVCKIGVSYTERNVWSPFVACFVFSQQVSTASGVCFDVLQSVFTQAVGSYSTARSIWSLME